MKEEKVMNPAAGAVVMAIGIFLYGAVEVLPLKDEMYRIILFTYTILAVYIFFSITKQLFSSSFRKGFFNNPVQSFTMGTWIAGLSVVCNVWLSYSNLISDIVMYLVILNTVFCLFFLAWSAFNLRKIRKERDFHAPHGVLLLATVAPQSVIIVWAQLGVQMWYLPLVAGGLIFYGWSAYSIGMRYTKKDDWKLEDDWTNTNCIFHGALSITGLALAVTGSLSESWLSVFWVVVAGIFIIVESVEVTRATRRVRIYGWKRGLMVYNTSQWSRNFTFGMFYAFSSRVINHPFLNFLGVVVLLLLIFEIALFLSGKFSFLHKEAGSPSR